MWVRTYYVYLLYTNFNFFLKTFIYLFEGVGEDILFWSPSVPMIIDLIPHIISSILEYYLRETIAII